MKYDILMLDHDDTCVDSTETIHYPAHLEVMKRIRPDIEPVDLKGWFSKNFDPGIMAYLLTELQFTSEELELELKIWRMFTESATPSFYPGILDMMRDFRDNGGKIAIVSHSEVHVIKSLYQKEAPDLVPDLIYGWEEDARKRKPNPWPAQEILRILDAEPERVLMIDDLKPGIDMAKNLGIPTAAAGWGHDIPEIREYMEANTLIYLESVDHLRTVLELD